MYNNKYNVVRQN